MRDRDVLRFNLSRDAKPLFTVIPAYEVLIEGEFQSQPRCKAPFYVVDKVTGGR